MRSSRTVSTPSVAVAAAVACVAALALAGCSDETPPGPSPSPSPSSPTASASPTPSTTPPTATTSPSPTASVPAGFSLDEVTSPRFPSLGGDLGGIGAVRVGRHDGFDRVVWQFTGTGRPTYRVKYVDVPTADGSGDAVNVRGAAYLEVLITTVSIPADGTPAPKEPPASALAGTVIAQAMPIYGGFEGYGQAFVGVRDEQRPFRVSVLANPTRLVVDIASG